MVTSHTISRSRRQLNAQRPPIDERSSPSSHSLNPMKETLHLKSSSSEATTVKNDLTVSPNLSEASTNDIESAESSGHDEFRLERFSSTLRRRQQEQLARKLSKKNHRPDLNVVTYFPSSQAKVLTSSVKVEEVRAKKIASKARPKSVVSAKAEHVYDSGSSRRAKVFATVKDLAAGRTEKNDKTVIDESKRGRRQAARDVDGLSLDGSEEISPVKPIIIGISIPKHEAADHREKLSHESAISLITPGTPRIVVTPVEEDQAFHRRPEPRSPMPASHVYPRNTRIPFPEPPRNVSMAPAPPMIKIRDHPVLATYQLQSTIPKSNLVRYSSSESIASDVSEKPAYPSQISLPRNSSESQQAILHDGTNSPRAKSQGWWNLALSPMLSRAGTIKNVFHRSSFEEPKVPPLPSEQARRLSFMTGFEPAPSPDTPRRIGMASARASTWSRWTTWEKLRNQTDTNVMAPLPVGFDSSKAYGSNANAAAMSGTGLAAEYFDACAIEQLSGQPYFDCENHSCSERLPQLQSIFDTRFPPAAQSSADSAAAATLPILPNQDVAHQRSLSDSTQVASEPGQMSPNVREATVATISRVKAVATPQLPSLCTPKTEDEATLRALEGRGEPLIEQTTRPVPAPPTTMVARYPNIAAIIPPPSAAAQAQPPVFSPGPVSPEAQRIMAPQGAVLMNELQCKPLHQTCPKNYTRLERATPAAEPAQVTVYIDAREENVEERNAAAGKEGSDKKAGTGTEPNLIARLSMCAKTRKKKTGTDRPKPTKRKRLITIFIMLLLVLLACVLLATQLHRSGDKTPSQQQWLNLTGYPPMPIGISTIIRPDITETQADCVAHNMWSCALPKEQHNEIQPNNPDQPNFRFEIKFQNGIVPSNMTVPLLKRLSDPFSEDLSIPNPSPPSRADQLFIGNTTDNITQPFDGEPTPFFMTFIPAFPIDPNDPAVPRKDTTASHLAVRQQATNITDVIPAPAIASDGSAAPANLLPSDPLPFSQPIKLYNRGLEDEHFGFYMYYDKAIFLSYPAALSNNTSQPTNQQSTNDKDGGSFRNQAQARCTFSQTRFLVQIYTNPSFGTLLGQGRAKQSVPSAVDYTPPGSFPYPTTIVIDRHGGNINKKAAYCYGVDSVQEVQQDTKAVVAEFRAVGGQLVNPAPGLFENVDGDRNFNQEAGGIDGGTGGCECRWQNWN